MKKTDWFKDYFGLRSMEDPAPKPAWYMFIDEVYDYREPPKMLGISYRE